MGCQTCGRRYSQAECSVCARNRVAAKAANEAQWYRDTGHCGGCGQPAVVCLCTDRRPCGCRDLHDMGGGIGADLAELFAEPVPVPVTADDNQPDLFS